MLPTKRLPCGPLSDMKVYRPECRICSTSGWLTNWTESVPSNAATWAFYVQLDCHRFARSGTNPGIAAALSALHCGSAAKRCPIRPAGGGAGRPLSLPYGCRPELRQLHSLVRPHPYTANGTKRRVRLMYSRYSSPKRATSALSSILAEAPKAIVDITARASVVVDPDFTGLPASGSAVKCTADAVRLNEPGSIRAGIHPQSPWPTQPQVVPFHSQRKEAAGLRRTALRAGR